MTQDNPQSTILRPWLWPAVGLFVVSLVGLGAHLADEQGLGVAGGHRFGSPGGERSGEGRADRLDSPATPSGDLPLF